MFRHVRMVAHHAGDLTAAFMYPVFAALFDAFYKLGEDESSTGTAKKSTESNRAD